MRVLALELVVFALAYLGCNGVSEANPPAAKPENAPVRATAAKKRTKKKHHVAMASASAVASAAPKPDAAVADAGAPPKEEAPEGMALVPAGTFTMGADNEGEMDERPAHKVTLKSFWLDIYEVTNGQYKECVEAKVCRPWREDAAKSMHYGAERLFRGPKQPVVGVSWDDAKTYCEWKGKRLPREAEWEHAARGNDGREYPWGNTPPDPKKSGCFGGCKGGATADVGSFPADAGPYGHHDLAGNVWEWTADYYDPYAYKRPGADKGIPGTCPEIMKTEDELRKNNMQGYTGSNPIPTDCDRVLRGGAFNYHAKGLRSSNRVHHPGGWRLLVAGFRCAKDAP